MTRQRQILVTVTYNDLGCIIDTKAEPRKQGRWVNNLHDIAICDQCGYMTPYDRAIDDYEYGNYCPNCGADMRERREDERI